MLLYILATFCIVSAKGYSVLDDDFLVVQSDEEILSWAESYEVKASRLYLTSGLVEEMQAWKTNITSRVDYNQGAVKLIAHITEYFGVKNGVKFEVHPETTESKLNDMVCHLSDETWSDDLKLDDILPPISDEEPYEAVGNETIDDVETVKFKSTEKDREKDVRKTVWAYYDESVGWVPVRYELEKYSSKLGSLIVHEMWTYSDYIPVVVDDEVFDTQQFGCDENAIKHAPTSEKVIRELTLINADDEKHVDHVFNHFKNKFQRKYAHEREHAMRKALFEENMRMISVVNRRNLGYKLGVNKFSDWTPEEMKRSQGAIPRPDGLKAPVAFPYDESNLHDIVAELPKDYDMRMIGYISPIKDQETCGSCWTFAATAVVESGLAKINGGRVLALSNQALVDCAYESLAPYAGGCDGGFDYAAYDFIEKHGLPTEEEYGPYRNKDDYCHIENMTTTYKITGYAAVTKDSPISMKVALVNNGPLFIYVHVSKEFGAYSSGIFHQTAEECSTTRSNHAVVLVGYGERDGELFWIIKNSWGTSWGVDGYMLVKAKENVCGINSNPTYPVFI